MTIVRRTPSPPLTPPTCKSSRSSWAGQLSLGPVLVPVKGYPAVVSASSGPLHQIHLGCGQRIQQQKLCPTHGQLTNAEIGKAFEYCPDDHLVITTEEQQALVPTDDHTIRVDALIAPGQFEFALLSGRSLYLIPTHAAATHEYALAAMTLNGRNVWAVGSMVLSDGRRPIALQSIGRRLLLHVLHFPEHRRADPGSPSETTDVSPQEVRNLEKALLPLYKSFSWDEYRDNTSIRLNALIAAKIATRDQQPTKPSTKRIPKTSVTKAARKRVRPAA